MTTSEQLRKRQEEIMAQVERFELLRGAASTDALDADLLRHLSSLFKSATGEASESPEQGLPGPSKEVQDFLRRAFSNSQFRALIERLADE